MKYTKEDLVNKMVELAHNGESESKTIKKLTKKDTRELINLFADAVQELVVNDGDALSLQGFMRIDKYLSKPTVKTSPQTGEKIDVPAKVRTRVKSSF